MRLTSSREITVSLLPSLVLRNRRVSLRGVVERERPDVAWDWVVLRLPVDVLRLPLDVLRLNEVFRDADVARDPEFVVLKPAEVDLLDEKKYLVDLLIVVSRCISVIL